MDDQIFDDQTRNEMPIEYAEPRSKFRAWLSHNAVLIASITSVLLLGGIFWYFLSGNGPAVPESNNVILTIKGPLETTSNNEAEYTITYRNGENAGMTGVSLEVLYPSGFAFKSATPEPASATGGSFNLAPVNEGESSQVVIRGKLSGSTGESKEIRARLRYRLSNFNSEFVVEQNIKSTILPPDLIMDISGPVDVINGQDMTFSVTFTNVTANNFDNLGLEMAYPAGFTFTSSSVPATRDNKYWVLPALASGSSASIDVTGSFTGSNREQKLVRADLGEIINNNFAPQLQSSATFQIIPSSLAISLVPEPKDLISLGETINFELKYANQGNIGLNNLIITVNLSGVALDFPRLRVADGVVTNQTITWRAASLPGLSVLSPNEEGNIRFSIPLRQSHSSNLKNQIISASASISSDEITKSIKAADVQLKLASALDLTVSGNYVSGSAPMKVGEPTLFNMSLALSNLSNDVSGTEIIASLPLPPQAWKNVVIPESERSRLSYDSNSGKIRWRIGDLAAFTGIFTPVRSVNFQIEITPTEGDKGTVMPLLKDIVAAGTDAFTGQKLEVSMPALIDVANINDDTMSSTSTSVE